MRLWRLRSTRLFWVLGLLTLNETESLVAVPLDNLQLGRLISSYPEVKAMRERINAEEGRIRAESFLENPKLGFMKEKNISGLGEPMTSFSVSQEVLFPTKYFYRGSLQSKKAEILRAELKVKEFEIRTKILKTAYALFSTQKTLELLEAQNETLKEIARIAEARHSTGGAAQQDEMKAHLEQTKLQAELLAAQEDSGVSEGQWKILTAATESPQFDKLPSPQILISPENFSNLRNERFLHLQHFETEVNGASDKTKLAAWESAPDFNLSYRRALSGAPGNNYAIGIELSLPLWFLMKQSAEFSATQSEEREAQAKLAQATNEARAEVHSLSLRVQNHQKLVKILETSLIPQSQSALNSSRSAYQTGRVSFLDLLDSERALYSIQITYFKTLAEWVESIARLEEILGKPISDLPSHEEVR